MFPTKKYCKIFDFFKKIAYNYIVRNSEIRRKGDVFMLAELRSRSQLTIPAEIIRKIGATEGDKFDVMEKDGGIFLCPVVVYPKEKLKKIAKLIHESKDELSSQKKYGNVGEMFADMGIDINNV
jgi:AbrB family looped-hinge helix DNA binding protein